jgi:hypothetical protein
VMGSGNGNQPSAPNQFMGKIRGADQAARQPLTAEINPAPKGHHDGGFGAPVVCGVDHIHLTPPLLRVDKHALAQNFDSVKVPDL